MRITLVCVLIALALSAVIVPSCTTAASVPVEQFAEPVLKLHVISREWATRVEPNEPVSDGLKKYLQENATAWEELYNMLQDAGALTSPPTPNNQ